jgi:hypothetical protein
VTRIVVDPLDLRRVATGLGGVAADGSAVAGKVGNASLPEMPASVAGVVRGGVADVSTLIEAQSPALQEGMKELRVRALWAEISARMELNQPLTDAQLQQFLLYMRDGSMVDYATPYQRGLAGKYIGERYRDTYTQPEQLIELADILRGSGSDADFAGAFIEAFGAENMANVPRVIQAMEWGPILSGSTSDAFYDNELANELMLDGYELDRDPLELLSGFSMALASATYAGRLTRETERALAYDEDSWAVAQLLHGNHVFGAEFLRDIFHSGVVAEIGRRSVISFGGGADMTSYAPIGGTRGDGIPTDQVQLILDALERNDEAVALALTDPVPEQFQIGLYLEGRDNPLEILYDTNRFWDDDGERLSRMYDSGVAYAHANGDLERAYQMTDTLIDRTLHSEENHEVMTEALARDLADHHMENIHLSSTASFSGAAQWIDVDGSGSEYDNAYRLMFDKSDLTDLLREFSDNDEANETVLSAARDYQAHLILENTTHPAGDGVVWAKQIGGFDGVLMNANDLERFEDFDADNARHRAAFSFLSSVTGAVQSLHPAGAAAGIVTGPVLTAFEGATGPSLEDLIERNDGAREAITNQMHAAIVTGYHENGLLHGDAAPPASILVNGHLIDVRGDITPEQLNQLLSWMENNGHVGDVVGDVFREADQARDNRDIDTGG